MECNSVIRAYGTLRAFHFNPTLAPLPPLGPPCGIPGPGVVYHHCSVSAHKLVERIGKGEGCPTISRQPTGTILIKINYYYANCLVSIAVPKLIA